MPGQCQNVKRRGHPRTFQALCGTLRSMFYFYVLKSMKDRELYFGSSSDLRQRLSDHNAGKSLATRARRPLRLVYYEAYASKSDALARERQMKSYGKAYAQLKRRLIRSIQEA